MEKESIRFEISWLGGILEILLLTRYGGEHFGGGNSCFCGEKVRIRFLKRSFGMRRYVFSPDLYVLVRFERIDSQRIAPKIVQKVGSHWRDG